MDDYLAMTGGRIPTGISADLDGEDLALVRVIQVVEGLGCLARWSLDAPSRRSQREASVA